METTPAVDTVATPPLAAFPSGVAFHVEEPFGFLEGESAEPRAAHQQKPSPSESDADEFDSAGIKDGDEEGQDVPGLGKHEDTENGKKTPEEDGDEGEAADLGNIEDDDNEGDDDENDESGDDEEEDADDGTEEEEDDEDEESVQPLKKRKR